MAGPSGPSGSGLQHPAPHRSQTTPIHFHPTFTQENYGTLTERSFPSKRRKSSSTTAPGAAISRTLNGLQVPGASSATHSIRTDEEMAARASRVRKAFSEKDIEAILDPRELSHCFEGLPLEEHEIKKQPKKLRGYYECLATLKEHYEEVDELLRSSLPSQIATSFRPAESAFPRYSRANSTLAAPCPVPGCVNQIACGSNNQTREISPFTKDPAGGALVDGVVGGVDRVDGYVMDGGEENGNGRNSTDSDRPSLGEVGQIKGNKIEEEEELLLPASGQREARREKLAKLALHVNFGINIFLLVAKGIAVISSSSISLVASFVDAALDFLSTLIILGTSILMGRTSDKHMYPVGKKRFEPLGVLIFSVAMIASFAQVFIESFQRAIGKSADEEVAELSWVGLGTMVATILIKSVVWVWCSKMESSSIKALAQDAENDVIFNLMSLAFPSLGQALKWRLLDPLGGMVLSAYIIFEWIKTLYENFQNLSGKTASLDQISRVLYLVSRFKPVKEIASIEVYHVGDDLIVEVELILPETSTLHFAHDLTETIQCVLENLDHVSRAYVHADYSSDNPLQHTSRVGNTIPPSRSSSRTGQRPETSKPPSPTTEAAALAMPAMPPALEASKRIPLFVSGGKAYCWEAQDVAILRVTHRICGLMTGTLPGVAQQNMFLGLPMVLMAEEVVLLVENGVCELIQVDKASQPPTSAQVLEHTANRVKDVSAQRDFTAAAARARQQQVEQTLSASDAVIRKRQQRIKEKGKQPAGSADQLFGEGEGERSVAKKTDFKATGNIFTVVQATSVSHPWFDPAARKAIFDNLDAARAEGVWTYPSNDLEIARCASFRKLWEEGMYLGQGIRFGGEFLVYPGDPLRYHSHFSTTTLPSASTVIRPLELVAWGRLGTATKKAHLICCYDETAKEEEGQEDEVPVECYSLEWGNFG